MYVLEWVFKQNVEERERVCVYVFVSVGIYKCKCAYCINTSKTYVFNGGMNIFVNTRVLLIKGPTSNDFKKLIMIF